MRAVSSDGFGPEAEFKAHQSEVSLLSPVGAPGEAWSLLLTGGANNLEIKLWNLATGTPTCIQELQLSHPTVPPEGPLPLVAAFEPRCSVLLLCYCPSGTVGPEKRGGHSQRGDGWSVVGVGRTSFRTNRR